MIGALAARRRGGESASGTTVTNTTSSINASRTPGSTGTAPFDIFKLATATGGAMSVVNILTNSTNSGIIDGSPGTLPTLWSSSLSGLVQTIAHGFDATTGLPYIDWHVQGTPTGNALLFVENAANGTGAPCLPSTAYIFSCNAMYLNQAGSSLTNVAGISFNLATYTSAAVFQQNISNNQFALPSSSTPITTLVTTNTTDASIQPYIVLLLTSGLAIGVTLRLIGVQLQTGSTRTAWQGKPITNFGVTRNAVMDASTPGTVSLLYQSHTVNRSDGVRSFAWNGSAWVYNVVNLETAEGATLVAPGGTMSASQVMGVAAPSGPFFVFQIVGADPANYQINKDGVVAGGNVVSLVYHNHTLFQHATDHTTFDSWWYWNTTSSVYTNFQVNTVNLSATTYAANAPNNTVIGTISVTMSDGSAFAGAITVSDTTNFKIVGNQLQAAATLSLASYSIILTVTPTAVGNAFASPQSITQSGTVSLIAYGTDPTTNGFPSPLPISSMNVAGQATSPMGWPIDFYDDFTGTFARIQQPNWYFDNILGSTNAFTTGALYKGALAVYGCQGVHAAWGGYDGIDTLQNVAMANSLLTFNVTNVGGQFHTSSIIMNSDTPWGYWEWSIRLQHGANGSRAGCGFGLWLSGSGWPTMGENDIIETTVGAAAGGGFSSNFHINTSSGTDGPFAQNGIFSSGTLPGGRTWDDGNFHIYGSLQTPSYIAAYVDGTLIGYTKSSNYLNNLSTTTDPPFASAAGSWGYLANQLNGSLSNVTYFDPTYAILFGYEVSISGGATLAMCPMKMDVDWWRHSKLSPASGGPHV